MSGWYLPAKQALLARTIPDTATVWIIGVNDEYVFDEMDTDFAALDPMMLLPASQLENVTFVNGILDADDKKWLTAGAGVVDRSLILKGVIVYFEAAGTQWMLNYIDSASVGLPQTLTGVDVTAYFDERGICKL